MKCVEMCSDSERHLATLYKINHTSDFHTLTDSKSHFTHLCFNDWISWPVLSAFVLSEEESRALVWKRGQWFYETARVTSAVTGRSLRLNTLSFWSSRGTLGKKTSPFPLELCARNTAGGNPSVSCCWENAYLLKKIRKLAQLIIKVNNYVLGI